MPTSRCSAPASTSRPNGSASLPGNCASPLTRCHDMPVRAAIKRLLSDIHEFTLRASLLRLRHYQIAPARAVIHSVLNDLGHSIVVVMPRQSGKNELQAQLETYLL